jgi:hypothetical protein
MVEMGVWFIFMETGVGVERIYNCQWKTTLMTADTEGEASVFLQNVRKYPVIQHHTPEDLSLEKHHCEDPETYDCLECRED